MNNVGWADSPLRARVVITGAAGGVGRACALAFAQLGAELVLCDHDALTLQHVARATGGLARFCDVASESSVEIFAADMLESFDRFDVLINAAGIGYVRSLGMMWMSRALLPAMRGGPGGKLIANVAPPPGLKGPDGLFPHACSEAAFGRLSESIALQTRRSAVRTATIVVGASGWLLARDAIGGDSPAAILLPLQRFDPSQIAATIAALACRIVPGLDCRRVPEPARRRA